MRLPTFYEQNLIPNWGIDMVAGQQQANWSSKGQSAVTSVSGQSLKAVVRRYFRWQVFRLRQGMKA